MSTPSATFSGLAADPPVVVRAPPAPAGVASPSVPKKVGYDWLELGMKVFPPIAGLAVVIGIWALLLRDINLGVAKSEFITLIGHSGCGKSTLLNLIAGLTLPTAGALICDGREIAAPGPERAVVFQNHSLLPWLTCFENVHLAVERVFGARESKAQ